MEEPGPGAGSLITPKPPENPEIQISDHGPESLISDHVVHNVNNMAGETADRERTSRSKVRSTSVGGGNTLDPHRKASAERRKRER